MGQAAVRAAVQSAIQGANIPLVGTVYPARAYIAEQDYEMNAAGYYTSSIQGSGCVIVVNLVGPDKRTRMTLTGRGAQDDMNIHPVALELFFANTLGDPVAAQQDYDKVVDGLVPFIRDNPNLTAPSVVWSAGEYRAGVVHTASEPFTDSEGMTVFINGLIKFEAWEQIVGVGV